MFWVPAFVEQLCKAMDDVVGREQITETVISERATTVLWDRCSRTRNAARIASPCVQGEFLLQADEEAPGSAHSGRLLGFVVAEALLRIETNVAQGNLARIADRSSLLTVALNVEGEATPSAPAEGALNHSMESDQR